MRKRGSRLKHDVDPTEDEKTGQVAVDIPPNESLVVPCSGRGDANFHVPHFPELPVISSHPVCSVVHESSDADSSSVDELRENFARLSKEAAALGFALVPSDGDARCLQIRETERIIRESDKLETANRMAAGVAHDLGNFLLGIEGNTAHALLDPSLSEETRKDLMGVHTAACTLIELVKKLQRFAGAGIDQLEYRPLDLKSLIEDVLVTIRSLRTKTVESHNMTSLELNVFCEEGVTVHGNASELTSVLVNLLKNSFEAMPVFKEGEALLPHSGEIDINVSRRGSTVNITLSDNGLGMDENARSNLFIPFFSTKGRKRTRGYGMSQVKAIIEEHGGQIRVKRSFPGLGSTFEIILPAPGSNIPPRFDMDTEIIGPKRILLVDDEEMVRNITERLLQESFKCEIVSVNSPRAAIDLLAEEEFSLVITDLNMPEMSGIELARKHKNSGAKGKVLVITGEPLHFSEDEMGKRGIDGILYKPYRVEEIKRCISRVLKKNA